MTPRALAQRRRVLFSMLTTPRASPEGRPRPLGQAEAEGLGQPMPGDAPLIRAKAVPSLETMLGPTVRARGLVAVWAPALCAVTSARERVLRTGARCRPLGDVSERKDVMGTGAAWAGPAPGPHMSHP